VISYRKRVFRAVQICGRKEVWRVVKAYVLMGCDPETAKLVAKALAGGEATNGEGKVLEAVAVTGDYDVIAIVEAPNLDAVSNFILERIQRVDGVAKTTTCLAVNLGGT
jgi:DNA-binding Lrp family transcriptional regulator